MDLTSILVKFRDLLNAKLLQLGGAAVTLGTLFTAIAIILATIVVARVIDKAIMRSFAMRGLESDGTARGVKRLTRYAVMIIGFLVAVDSIGIDLGALFAAGAVFAVGIGFAMQNIVQNFVSGVILLIERSIKPGDVLEVDGQIVHVQEMGIRATIVRTRDEEEMIVPNSSLVQGTVKNFTMRDSLFRLRVTVGVTYGSDMALVRRVLQEVGENLAFRSRDQVPRVFLAEFGDSSVNFELAVWSDDPWMSRVHMSEMREAIWFAFLDRGITIAFPQLDVHFDPPVSEGLSKLARAA